MELRIKHTTGFVYDAPARASYHEARLTPLSDARQTVRSPHLDVDPQPWSTSYTDYWGARVTAFEVLQAHAELTVTATSSVRTTAAPPPAVVLGWDDLAEPRVVDELAEFLVVGEAVRPSADLALRAAKLVADGARPGEVALEVCRDAGVLEVIGALRSVGLPCRYVSGYVLEHGTPQAWLEWWDGAWQPFDPVMGAAPGDDHVTRAVGRDPSDVRALRGICTGAGVGRLVDEVEMTRLA